jgi:TatD DNase family protein
VNEVPVARWVDAHCHLSMLSGDPEATMARARAAGVVAMVCVGTDLTTSRAAVELAAAHPEVRATVGLHPHTAEELVVQWNELERLAVDHPDTVAGIGECGFDFHYAHAPAVVQETAFRAQVRLAHRLDRTLVIHSRKAWDDTFRVLADEGVPARTVLHCFTGGPEEAGRALELGAYLSFSGIVSFPNAGDLRAAAAVTPLDRALVETDAPYLAPVPYRGRENEPAWVAEVGAALAGAMGVPVAALAAATTANAAAVFGAPTGTPPSTPGRAS